MYQNEETDEYVPDVDLLCALNLASFLLGVCLPLPFSFRRTSLISSFPFWCHDFQISCVGIVAGLGVVKCLIYLE